MHALSFLRLKHHSEYRVAWLDLDKLKPGEKVNLSISMTDACVQICIDGLKDQDDTIREEEFLEKVRARIMYNRHQHYEV